MAMIMWCRVSLILRSLKLEPAETIDLEGGLDANSPEEEKSEEVEEKEPDQEVEVEEKEPDQEVEVEEKESDQEVEVEEEEPDEEVEVEVASEDGVDASASSSTHSVMPLD